MILLNYLLELEAETSGFVFCAFKTAEIYFQTVD